MLDRTESPDRCRHDQRTGWRYQQTYRKTRFQERHPSEKSLGTLTPGNGCFFYKLSSNFVSKFIVANHFLTYTYVQQQWSTYNPLSIGAAIYGNDIIKAIRTYYLFYLTYFDATVDDATFTVKISEWPLYLELIVPWLLQIFQVKTLSLFLTITKDFYDANEKNTHTYFPYQLPIIWLQSIQAPRKWTTVGKIALSDLLYTRRL